MILEKKKTVILKDAGLDKFEQNPSKIFTCAMQTYMKKSGDFDNVFKVIEQYHQKTMIAIFKGETVAASTLTADYHKVLNDELYKLQEKDRKQ